MPFLSLRFKLLISFTILFGVISTLIYFWVFHFASGVAMDRIKEDLVNTLRCAVNGVDANRFETITKEAQPRDDGYTDFPLFWEHVKWLYTINQIEKRAFVYTYVASSMPDHVEFIGSCGALWDPPVGAKFREVFLSKGKLIRGLSTETLNLIPYQDKWGRWISAYTPILTKDGRSVGGLGLDFKADYVFEVQGQVRNYIIVAAGVTYLSLVVLVFLFSTVLTRRLKALTKAAHNIGDSEYDEQVKDLIRPRIEDEISFLAQQHIWISKEIQARRQELEVQLNQKEENIVRQERVTKELKELRDKLRLMSDQLIQASEVERRKVAAALHDTFGQKLMSLNLGLKKLEREIDVADLKKSLVELIKIVSLITEESRSFIQQLSPPVLYELGLVEALDWLAEKWSSEYETEIIFSSSDDSISIPEKQRIVLFWATRELIFNAIKHSSAKQIEVTIYGDEKELEIEVSDDGVGLEQEDPFEAPNGSGLGLFTINERMLSIGGWFEVRNRASGGVRALVRLHRP